jgi:hypothetical protein
MQESLVFEFSAGVILLLSGVGWYKFFRGEPHRADNTTPLYEKNLSHASKDLLQTAFLLANPVYLTEYVKNSTNLESALGNCVAAVNLLLLSGSGTLFKDIRNFGRDSEIGTQVNKLFDSVEADISATDDVVILFEGYLWIYFLFERLWEFDPDNSEIGKTSDTMPYVRDIAHEMFGGLNREQFETYWNSRMSIYKNALDERRIEEAFAEVIILSEGRESLAEPLSNYNHVRTLRLDNLALNLNIRIFFSSIPQSLYNAFKGFRKLRPDCFGR